MAHYPGMFNCLPAKVNVGDNIPTDCFKTPCAMLTVSVLLHSLHHLFLIKPKNAPTESRRLIFPQGKAKRYKDITFGDIVLRELFEEVELSPDDVTLHPWELHRFANHLPLERTKRVPVTKNILFFAAYIDDAAILKPRPSEVVQVVKVTGDEFLDATCCSQRIDKCTAQTEAVIQAIRLGLLQRESWNVFAGHNTLLAA